MDYKTLSIFLKRYEDTRHGISHTYLNPIYTNKDDRLRGYKKCNSIYPGKWNIPNDKLEEFYNIYAREYKKGYSIVERHKDNISPIVIDLDIRQESKKRKLNIDIIEDIVSLFYSEIERMITLDENNSRCYIMQRNKMYKKGELYKDGIHIIYPNIVTRKEYQTMLRKNLLNRLGLLFEKNNIEGKIEEIYDESVIDSNGMMLYMSSKYIDDEWIDTYEIIKEYELKKCEIVESEKWKDKHVTELLNELSLRNKKEIVCNKDYIKNIENMFGNAVCSNKLDPFAEQHVGDKIKQEMKESTHMMSSFKMIDKKDYAQLLDKLPDMYHENYNEWIKIGMITKNIFGNSGLSIFMEFSKKCTGKYNENDTIKKYMGLKQNGGLNIGTLYKYLNDSGNEDIVKEKKNKCKKMEFVL